MTPIVDADLRRMEMRHFCRIVRLMVRDLEDRIEDMEVGDPAFHGLTYQLGGLEQLRDHLAYDPEAVGYPAVMLVLRDAIDATIH